MDRIARIEPFPVHYPDPNDFNTIRRTVLVRVETDHGVVGWGECIAMWPEACKAVALVICEGLLPLLQGEPAQEIEANWHRMRRHVWWYGEGGIASLAISGIDMALWDIAGKIAGKPLYDLLGGLKQDRLLANASSHVNKKGEAACVAEVVGFFEAGFRSCKLGFAKKGESNIGGDPDTDVSFIRALRSALGDEAGILVDIGNGVRWDADTAISVANRMHALGIGWYEEPLYPTDDAGYRRLRANTAVRIASGEREFTEAGYRRQMEFVQAIDVYGVDPARVEGVTGFRRVDALATRLGKGMNAHAWSTAITTAASLHLSLASPNTEIFEYKPFGVVVQDDLVAKKLWHKDGWAYPIHAPGLGIEVQEAVVKRLAMP
ncbi:MAG: mandelate racemase/muconate lactonizing enzyme family protein [Rhodobacter sp.]|nr:mandelate racemase/muconate lactonizing enzyme family protein [Rhodobacter sp.]MCA3458376.1 mandelate racemase/muconate lactonizing enzyme family protein [Rhodobacter sp.]MCA3462639.1 mandelate racemase/muconate lactonizing enzyme family protein [Rhodobacter sp.]MCA3463771.1 mandelate racemase/muconate lactonizing enzyme family protein [Rhodobacter sp.]MCA3469133.1 mandelate racemase/muconate lactonizing enzyme family protein [Rhodobacter sp.]